MEETDLAGTLSELSDLPTDPPDRRPTCLKCSRPMTVCWCAYLPREPIKVNTSVTILQHPYEVTRRLKTAPMLYHALPQGSCQILKGRRFNIKKKPDLARIVNDPQTLLLFPGEGAEDLKVIAEEGSDKPYNLILLDGTWLQAKGIYLQNPFLQHIRKVELSSTVLSEYVIRTQPTDTSLSTLETAVHALALLENRPDIIQPMLNPLRALCEFQMAHGAVKHQSKQYLVENGLYKKQPPPDQRRSRSNAS